ncbi:MAG: enoyl-CoA hydratase/isomerase family protein [Deltaproteobacteria bacterium]|nr:enoyl-CoA hydratase/isomerase family protein [Deltaproteobacteria bacterium]
MTQKTHQNAAVRGELDADGVATLTLSMEGRANKIDDTFGNGLEDALSWALAQPETKGIVIASAHKDFCVGADIERLYAERDPLAMLLRLKQLNGLFRKLETSGKPVAAALTGTALGGGFELALSCHRRIALSDARIQLGLPEVSLGVMPGAGGTQRLPRLVGIQKALEYIAQGKLARPKEAKDAGLVDELADTREDVVAKAKAWVLANPNAKQPWDRPGFAFPGAQPQSEEARGILLAGAGMLRQKTAGVYPAPEIAMSSVQEGAHLTFERAIEVESRHFARLATSDQAKDMIRTIWFHRQAAEKHVGLPSAADAGIAKVSIIGAGMMGAGLAFISAKAGYQVVLKDISDEALEKGMSHIKDQAKKLRHLSDEERSHLLARVTPTKDPAPIAGSDLVIEAVFEKLALKHSVTTELEPTIATHGIWASNTSAIPITDLAKPAAHKDRFIGLHFFSPVEKMELLEIVMGKETSDETLGRSLAFAKSIKKLPIVVNDGYGFYTSRTFSSYIIEGACLVAEGVSPVLVEWAARSAGMVVPPLQVFDEVSLSLGRHALEQSREYIGEAADRKPGVDLIVKMVDAGRLGRAHGAGFYEYENGKRSRLWPGLGPLVGKKTELSVKAIEERLLLAQCAEAARCVESGLIRNRRDAEVGAIFGIGFAPNTGGPLSLMDRLGIGSVVSRLRSLSSSAGPRFACPSLLVQMAERGETFFPKV